MKTIIGLAASLMIVLLGGCSTYTVQVERLGMIRNEAKLHYAYGGMLFKLTTPPCDVAIVRPVAHMKAQVASSRLSGYYAGGKQLEDTKGSRLTAMSMNAGMSQSDLVAPVGKGDGNASISQGDANALITHSDAQAAIGSKTAKGTADSRDQSSSQIREAFAGQEYAIDAKGNTYQTDAQSKIGAEDVRTSLRASAHSGMDDAEAMAGSSAHLSANAFLRHRLAGANIKCLSVAPTVNKWSTRANVLYGDKFQYIVEITNQTPIDLAIVRIEETLDPRLLADLNKLRTSPEHDIELEKSTDGFRVNILSGLKHGKMVRLHIPVMIKMPDQALTP